MAEKARTAAVPADIAENLEVYDGRSWVHCPAWLAFFFRLGQVAAATHEAGTTTCTVVIPPVRSFASLFAAAGAVTGVAATAEAVPDVETHYRELTSLQVGASLVVRNGRGKIYAAKYMGEVERNGLPFLKIRLDGMDQQVPKSDCQRVQVGSGGKKTLPKALRRSSSWPVAIESLLGSDADGFLSVPTVDTVLIGQQALLRREAEGIRIRSSTNRNDSAPLAELLRAREFLPDGAISRSSVLSDRVAEFQPSVKDTPHVAVFDGGRAFSRYRTTFNESSWIVVLDRCSATYREGVDVANQQFATRHAPADFMRSLNIPPGTEIQAFER